MARPEGGTGADLDDIVDELQKIAKLSEVSNDIQTGIQALLTGRPAAVPRVPSLGGTPMPIPLPTPPGAPPAGSGGFGGRGSSSSSPASTPAPSGFFRSRIHRFKAWRTKARTGAYKAARAFGGGRKASVGIGKIAGKAGAVGAVVVGVVTAFEEARKAIRKWTDEAMATARQLAQLSGSMAVVMAQRDIMEMSRMIRRGEATAGTTQRLVGAESRRKEEELKINIAIDNMKNSLLTVLNDLLASTLKPIATGVAWIAKKFDMPGDVEASGLGGALPLAMAENDKMNAAGKNLMDIARAAAMGKGVVAPAGAGVPGFGAMKPPLP